MNTSYRTCAAGRNAVLSYIRSAFVNSYPGSSHAPRHGGIWVIWPHLTVCFTLCLFNIYSKTLRYQRPIGGVRSTECDSMVNWAKINRYHVHAGTLGAADLLQKIKKELDELHCIVIKRLL